jgi:Ca2+-binding EF-hand superfamily protein/Skp family chaperone for outer membrane proteins
MARVEQWSTVDGTLDQIIQLAASLKGHVGDVKGKYDQLFLEKEEGAKRVHADLESLQQKFEHTSVSNREERAKLERQISEKEAEQKRKTDELDTKVKQALEEKERSEREREAARGDADQERRKLAGLLKDLEEDALSYNRLRPSKPVLSDDDVSIIRQLFLSSAVAGTGKLSFSELKQILQKYSLTVPEGALKKLFKLVEEDTKGRMSYITVVGVANDLTALVGDFRIIDTNSNSVLSRKEFREHFTKLGFTKKDTIDAIFRFADEDESDEVGFNEYIYLSLSLLVLRILYSFADYDKSGSLSKEEVKKVLEDAAIPAKAISKFDHFFSVVDKDDSKTLGYVEFVMLVLLMFTDD